MIPIYFDLEKSQRDKSKLVYVQRTVTKNGKTFQQGFWVSPSQVKATDTVLQGQNVLTQYQQSKASTPQQPLVVGNFDKAKYTVMFTTESKAKAMQYAKDNGISWNEHSNPNINWMRCQMAVNKALGGSITISANTSKSSLNTSQLDSEFDSLSKKDKIVELLKYNSRDSLISFAKANGISWKETDNAGINWMRASMAIQKYLETNNLKGDSKNKQNEPQKQKPVSEKLSYPADATQRQKNLVDIINSLSKKEDIELYKSVGMIAEDDAAKEFIEKTLKPRYDAWKNGHQPSAGSSNYGYIIDGGKEFGKNIVDDKGVFLKGLNVAILQQSFREMYDNTSVAAIIYPRDILVDDKIPGKNLSIDRYNKTTARRVLNPTNLIYMLNRDFSVRETSETDEFRYSGWDTKVYQKFPPETHGFVKVLDHIKSKNPELGKECDRISGIYRDMLKLCGNNPQVLNEILDATNYEDIENSLAYTKKRVMANRFFAAFCKDNGLSPQEADYTIEHMRGRGLTTVEFRKSYWEAKTDSNGNPMTANFSDYLKDHQSEYPSMTAQDLYDNLTWTSHGSIRKLLEGKEVEEDTKYNAISSVFNEELYCSIRRKLVEMYDYELVNDLDNTKTFDTKSTRASEWDRIRANYTKKSKENEDLDTIIANMSLIRSCSETARETARYVSWKTRPSKANDNGLDLSKTFNWYYRDGFQDYNIFDLQNSKKLSIDEVNKKVQSQLESMPTVSKSWVKDVKSYVEKHGNESFKSEPSWRYSAPSTEVEKKCAKAFSIDMGSKGSVTEYMGTPVGDIIVKHCEVLSKYCPQMISTRINTQAKVEKSIHDKLGYKPFKMDAPQTISDSIPEIRQLREELFSKVHCTLKSCDTVQYDAIQTEIKHNWDMGKRNSSGQRLYGHISAVFKGAYKVNNSLQEELMLKNAQKLNETPQLFFHGTNHSGATGIIGVDGRFRAPKSSADASKQGLKYAGGMLGSGVYLAKMAGKSAGYFGTWGSSYEPEGCMLMCKAVLGNTYVASNYSGSSAPASYDTVSMQAGTNTGRTILRADEWCVRNPDFVYPEFIVDMGTKRRI